MKFSHLYLQLNEQSVPGDTVFLYPCNPKLSLPADKVIQEVHKDRQIYEFGGKKVGLRWMPVILQNAAEGYMVVHQMNYFSFYTLWASVIYRNIGKGEATHFRAAKILAQDVREDI